MSRPCLTLALAPPAVDLPTFWPSSPSGPECEPLCHLHSLLIAALTFSLGYHRSAETLYRWTYWHLCVCPHGGRDHRSGSGGQVRAPFISLAVCRFVVKSKRLLWGAGHRGDGTFEEGCTTIHWFSGVLLSMNCI